MALQRRERYGAAVEGADGAASAGTPGKSTLTQELAADGVRGAGSALPFADQIAASFGPAHAGTVQSIEAHTGGAAAAAADGIGARAYTTGNAVAFGSTPDLHTAAHEAAHVVQQRQGVHLKGGVGEAGDPYEQHADAVADRVVSGLSAASLLGGEAGEASAAPAVQRKGDGKAPKHDAKKDAADFEADGPMVVYALSGVFRNDPRMMESMPSKYVDAMKKLNRAVNGDRVANLPDLAHTVEHRALWDEAAPVFERFAMSAAHFGGPDDDLPARFQRVHQRVITEEAQGRAENAVIVGEGKQKKAMDMPDDRHPREQGAVLQATLPTLVSTIKTTIGRAKALGEQTGVSKEMLERLEAAEHVLSLGESFLKLNDEEFQKEINHVKSVMGGIATYSELVKHVLEIGSSSIALTCKASALLMKAVGDHAMAEACEHTGAAVSAGLGKVVAAVEIVHGVSILFDKNASTDDRIGAGVEIASGVVSMAGGSSVAALPIMGPYALIKGAQHLFSEAVLGFDTDEVRGIFKNIQTDAVLIGRAMEHLAAAQLLQQQEQDPERRAALVEEEQRRTVLLHRALESFLTSTADAQGSDLYKPGKNQIISDAFAVPRHHLAAARSPGEVADLAHEVVKHITWCFDRGPAIIQATATHKSIVDVDALEQKIESSLKKD
jgi:hypothetical protein